MERPLFWHQGLFLQPQHFQLENSYFQSLLTPYHKFIQPFLWGVAHLEIQKTALNNFSFTVIKGECLFSDMTYAVSPGNAIIETRSFENAWVESDKPLTVYLGLRKLNPTGDNVTTLPNFDNLSDTITRFASREEPEDVRDMYKGGVTAQIKHMSYVIKIFFETEIDQLGNYDLIPVARIERNGDEILLSDKFAPPCLTLESNDNLHKLIMEIRDQVASKSNRLEAYKRERGIHTSEFGARDMVYLLALRSLNRYVPLLFHITETKNIHPWHVYASLRQLIGELSTFSDQVNVNGEEADGTPLLPVYQHKNLWSCFSKALSLITRLLDSITSGPDHILKLEYDETYYTTEISPKIFEGQNRFYIVITTETNQETVINAIDSVVKVSSRESLPLIIARALPGIKLTHIQIPPQELPRRANSIYFQVDHHSEKWQQVQKNGNLAMYWDSAMEDLAIELMVVGRA
ncbi:MAG: type VI secretion system baseplate subunit TssK [Proteobacteria bacterium]|nr:type VI secretion system baseplate subunit TssK [Pseudomonadota bacterium]